MKCAHVGRGAVGHVADDEEDRVDPFGQRLLHGHDVTAENRAEVHAEGVHEGEQHNMASLIGERDLLAVLIDEPGQRRGRLAHQWCADDIG